MAVMKGHDSETSGARCGLQTLRVLSAGMPRWQSIISAATLHISGRRSIALERAQDFVYVDLASR